MARTDQRSIPIALIVLAAALLIARFAYSPKEVTSRGLVRWLPPQTGILLAQQTGKPMLINFTAAWCRPCTVLDEEVFADRAIADDLNDRYIAIRVTDRKQEEGKNAPDVEAFEQRYAVRAFPTVVFTDANGAEQARMEGFRGREEFERILERVR